MGELAKGLLVAALVVSAIVPLIGVLRGQPLHQMVLTGLTLAFATIPEELPILVVIVLGFGALRLAQRGAIVRRLIAAETLGATTLICTDKTGTLTENRMSLAVVTAAERRHLDRRRTASRRSAADRAPGQRAAGRSGSVSSLIAPAAALSRAWAN